MMVIYTRAYVLYVCGEILFPTKSNNVVHPRLILFLEDPNKIYGYAWGAAVLAYMYKNLQEASRKDVRSISGCTIVLMLWSRERLRPGQFLIAPNTRMIWLGHWHGRLLRSLQEGQSTTTFITTSMHTEVCSIILI